MWGTFGNSLSLFVPTRKVVPVPDETLANGIRGDRIEVANGIRGDRIEVRLRGLMNF
jgi:hypothetical protein